MNRVVQYFWLPAATGLWIPDPERFRAFTQTRKRKVEMEKVCLEFADKWGKMTSKFCNYSRMKHSKKQLFNLTCAVLALLAPVGLSAADTEVDGYIIYGQSNANGRSYNNELSDQSLRHAYDKNIFYAYRERSWKDGGNPVDLGLGAIRPDQLQRIGVEVTLGRQLAIHSERPVLLVKFCSGGTSIKNYLPETENLFQPMLAYLKGKEKEMAKKGYRVKWKKAFVVTGESDCSEESAPLFKQRFLEVKKGLEKGLGLSSLPTVYSLLRGEWVDTPASNYSRLNPWAVRINTEMKALAEQDPTIMVSPSNADLKTRLDNGDSKKDGIHYSSDSYARLGFRLYRVAFPNRPD